MAHPELVKILRGWNAIFIINKTSANLEFALLFITLFSSLNIKLWSWIFKNSIIAFPVVKIFKELINDIVKNMQQKKTRAQVVFRKELWVLTQANVSHKRYKFWEILSEFFWLSLSLSFSLSLSLCLPVYQSVSMSLSIYHSPL